MFDPVQRQSLSEAVFDQLRQRIVRGEVSPGGPLPAERALSETLGVNRGAVREALKRLEQAGLVAIQQGGATRVLDFRESAGLDLLPALLSDPDGGFDLEVVRSVMEMRSALAPEVARRAAERIDAAGQVALREAVAAIADTDDLAALQLRSLDFWTLLVRASGNVAYQLAYNSLQQAYRHAHAAMRSVLADELRATGRYEAVARAVQAGDAASAAKQATELVEIGARAVTRALSSPSAQGRGAR